MNYKMVLVLLFGVVVNLVVFVLVWRLDFFVHGDLYSYGLIYSRAWAVPYINYSTLLWTLLVAGTALAAASMVPHYLLNRELNRSIKWAGFLLPVLGAVYEGLALFFFNAKNSIVWNTLSDYGLRFDLKWAATYNAFSVPVFVLMLAGLVAMLIPAVRAVITKR
jgi:hypothetical protein